MIGKGPSFSDSKLNLYHPSAEKIINMCRREGVWYEVFEHEPVRTSRQASKVRPGFSLRDGAKALILEIKQGAKEKYAMVVVPGDRRFDSGKVRKVLGAKSATFAKESDVYKLTGGILLGGIPPFGNLFNLETFADKSIFESGKMVFNAGDRSLSIAIRTKDYKRLVAPRIVDIV